MGKASEALKIEEDPYISSPDKCLGMNNRLGVYPQREELFGDDALISIKCPHCHNAFSNQKIRMWFGTDSDGAWAVSGTICPTRECQRLVLYLEKGDAGLIIRSSINTPRIRVTFNTYRYAPQNRTRLQRSINGPCP